MKKISALTLALVGSLVIGSALAAPVNYKVDATHTYPSFEADHMGGLSLWRGKFNTNSGTIVYDKEAKAGTVDITIDVTSIDFGMDKLNDHAKSPDMFDVAKFPTATYKGTLVFTGDTPTGVKGELSLHGVTKPVDLKINSFLCKSNTVRKIETCGADAIATINREDFGISYGKPAFKMDVTLRIQVEAATPLP